MHICGTIYSCKFKRLSHEWLIKVCLISETLNLEQFPRQGKKVSPHATFSLYFYLHLSLNASYLSLVSFLSLISYINDWVHVALYIRFYDFIYHHFFFFFFLSLQGQQFPSQFRAKNMTLNLSFSLSFSISPLIDYFITKSPTNYLWLMRSRVCQSQSAWPTGSRRGKWARASSRCQQQASLISTVMSRPTSEDERGDIYPTMSHRTGLRWEDSFKSLMSHAFYHSFMQGSNASLSYYNGLSLKIKTSYGHAIALWKKRCGIDQKRLII